MNSRGATRLPVFARLSGIFLLLLLRPGLTAAGEEQEIGDWFCMSNSAGSCPPDGRGRGPEDFWTLPLIEQSKKISVSCEMTDTRWTERCLGLFRGMLQGQEVPQWGGAQLFCPHGYVRRFGNCVEVERPRSDRKCSPPAGSPVDPTTGENRQAVTDMRPAMVSGQSTRSAAAPAAPGTSLELNRYYSSQPLGMYTNGKSRLGNGWRTSFDAEAAWDGQLSSTRTIHVQLPDFEEYSFALLDGAWKPVLRTDGIASLAPAGSSVTLRLADGTRYVFNDKRQLSQIAYPSGYTQTLTYTGDLNTRVTDSRGQWLNFVHGPAGSAWAGLLVVAQGSDGSLIRYSYEDRSQAGRKQKDTLTAGTNQWALKTVTYPDTTPSIIDNPRTIYEYLDNFHRPYLITTATIRPSPQPSTWSTTKWTYDVKKRVTSAERSIGKERWQYAYDDAKQQVTVSEPAGLKVFYARKLGSNGITTLDPIGGVETTSGSPSGLPPNSLAPGIVVPPPIAICWLGNICPPPPPMCMGPSEEDALDRCRKAAEGDDDAWRFFCNASSFFVRYDKTRPARCQKESFKSETSKKNWCANEFGD